MPDEIFQQMPKVDFPLHDEVLKGAAADISRIGTNRKNPKLTRQNGFIENKAASYKPPLLRRPFCGER